MHRSLPIPTFLVLALIWGACSVAELNPEGKRCPCRGEFVCDPVKKVCLRASSSTDGGSGDAGSCPTVPVLNKRALSSGKTHVCAVQSGALYCWGKNADGQLGHGTTQLENAPRQVGTDSDWRAVSAGWEHTCALHENGQLECWGSNTDGRLGVGDEGPRLSPTKLTGNLGFQLIEAGGDVTCAVETLAGGVWCWGDANGGGVGNSQVSGHVTLPSQIAQGRHSALSVGTGHGCAITEAGQLSCWGFAGCGENGLRNNALNPQPVGTGCTKAVSAGHRHTCIIDSDDRLFCWGSNEHGAVGVGVIGQGEPGKADCDVYYERQAVLPDRRFTAVEAGWTSTCAITIEGELWCWGSNELNGLSQSSEKLMLSPQQVGTDTDWVDVAPGQFHTCGRKQSGEVYCMGGDGQVVPHSAPLTPISF